MTHLRSRSLPRRLTAAFVAVPFLLAACTSTASGPTDEPIAGGAAPSISDAPAVGPTAMAPSAMAPSPAATASWLDIELTDAETGKAFTLASLSGKVVAVEPMAIWCTNCKAQQDRVKSVYDDISGAGVTYISLGVDPGEDAKALARYADQRGYGWTFSQAPKAFSRALRDLFGSQVLSPPSTPLIVLDASGEVAYQGFGSHAPDELLAILQDAAA